MKYIPMKLWLLVIGVVAVVIFFVVLSFKNKEPEKTVTQQTNAPVTLQIYQDPHNYFSLLIPSNWTTHTTIEESTKGINTPDPIPQQADITEFTSPTGTKLTIQIYSGQPVCPLATPVNANFGTYPASFDEAGNFWSIGTTDATIVVGIENATSDADKKVLNEILTNFKISNPQPFQCE